MKKRDIRALVEMITDCEEQQTHDTIRSIVGLEGRRLFELLKEAKRRGYFDKDKCFEDFHYPPAKLFTHRPSNPSEYTYTDFYDVRGFLEEYLAIPARGVMDNYLVGGVTIFKNGEWSPIFSLSPERAVKDK